MTAFPDERLTAVSGETVSLNHTTKPHDSCFYFKLLDFKVSFHYVNNTIANGTQKRKRSTNTSKASYLK